MDRILIAGLMKMELRDGRTIRLCDGGFLVFDGETYRGADDTFGTIGRMESFEEGIGDEVPAFRLTLLPPSGAAVADITAPGMQGSRTRFWIAEVNPDTGVITGTPTLMGDMQIDRSVLRVGKGRREVDMDFTSKSERLFAINKGNTLSPAFHKYVNPGELGEDNATGLEIAVPWGVAAQSGGGAGTAPLDDFLNRLRN